MDRLKDRVVVITGAGRGIGASCAKSMAAEGAAVVVNDLGGSVDGEGSDTTPADEVVAEIRAAGGTAVANHDDVSDFDAAEQIIRTALNEYGRLDCLVNNAASGVQRSVNEITEKHWNWTHDVNVKAPWLCSVAAAKLMSAGGSIVNISSLGSNRVLPYYVAVGTSKAALESLTRYLAVEFASDDIRVNAVSGGVVRTDALSHFPNRDYMEKISEERTPAGRLVSPDDIAKATVFLASEDALMIRGQVLVVDGGYSLVGI